MRNASASLATAAEYHWTDTGERRANHRLRTVYRVARVSAKGDRGLARLLNISDGGMMLSLSLDVLPGDALRVDLAEDRAYETRVIWREGQQCGVRLRTPINSLGTLQQLCEDRRSGEARPLRIPLSKAAIACSELGLHPVRLQDISQSGMKVLEGGRFKEGLAVKVRVAPGIERRGVVRWVRDGRAGIVLRDVLTVEELGSMNRF